jgi:integrase
MGSSTNRNYTPVGRFFYILISMLNLFLNSETLVNNTHKNSSQYWIPLLGFFTGARLNELCQLHLCDIKEIDNVWILDINEEDSKKIKNLN